MTFKDRILNKVTLLNEAEKIVKNKPPYKKFIDGTPLSNDIAVWMADFVYQHTTDLTIENNQLRADLKQLAGALNELKGLVNWSYHNDDPMYPEWLEQALSLPSVQAALKEKEKEKEKEQ